MKVTVFDLELNQPSEKIIQIGAVVGDVDQGKILESYEVLVNPNESISPEIVALTGITDEMIEQGATNLHDAFRGLKKMHERQGSIASLLQWGVYDTQILRTQLFQDKTMDQKQWVFGRRWIDVKALFQTYCIVNNQRIYAGLKKSMKRMGLAFQGKAHSAAADAANTFALFIELSNRLKEIKPPA